MNIDHVTIAGSSLEAMRESFARLGLATDYGGPHSNGITHMALLGFDDGSYIELISTLKVGQTAPWWDRFIAGDSGPCAWAVRADDVAAEAKRIAGLGIPVRGPESMNRTRPDGQLVEWDLAYLGEGDPGLTLPFIIHDRTPRDLRVTPSASVRGSELRGVSRVVIMAKDLHQTDKLYSKVYGAWEAPRGVDEHLPAELQTFDNLPVIVASPLDPRKPLGLRLEQYGSCPLAFLIHSTDMEKSARRFPQAYEGSWFENRVLWLPTEGELPWLGIIDW
jgi:catechol 2,3-dioxygenase-like lactoylglutathione lyase family enzyme